MANFKGKEWQRFGNHYLLTGTSICVFCWNTGANAWFMVTSGYGIRQVNKCFRKGPAARDHAIEYALSIREDYKV